MKQVRSLIAGGLLAATATAVLLGSSESGQTADDVRPAADQICVEQLVPQDPGYGLSRQVRRLHCDVAPP